MIKKSATILEIGSSKLKVMVVCPGINDTFVVKNSAEIAYEGYFQGEFVDMNNFKECLKKLFNSIDYRKRRYYKKIFVGLPAEFLAVSTAQINTNFRYMKKIRKGDLDALFSAACERVNTLENEVVNVSPISYMLDDDGISLNDPLGKKAMSIEADISIVLARRKTIEMFNDIFFNMGFERIEYISETQAQATYVIPEEEREDLCMLIDCGHLTTSVSFVQGQGLLDTKTFSVGGGHISGDLSEIFELTYKDAEKFKSQVVLSLQGTFNDKYEFPLESGAIEKINLNEANNAVAYRIEEIGKILEQSINEIPTNIAPYMPIYLVGCGLLKIKGGKNLLAKYLGKNIIEGVIPVPGKDKPEHTAIYSLAEYALKKCK